MRPLERLRCARREAEEIQIVIDAIKPICISLHLSDKIRREARKAISPYFKNQIIPTPDEHPPKSNDGVMRIGENKIVYSPCQRT